VPELAFRGAVGATIPKAVVLTNDGDAMLKLTARNVAITGKDAKQFAIGSRPAGLAHGKTGKLNVRYHPSKAGKHKATLTITIGDAMQSVVLNGEAT
jgi:hypothetical protein